ncbi:MAG: glycosyl hydrolase, partial [Akkermansiaceae bacterium]
MKDSKRQAAAAVPPGVPSRKIFMGSAWLLACLQVVGAAPLEDEFREPPNPAKPGVYWYFMDGNIDRKELIRDLDSMKEAGLGHVLWLEVNVDVPRGPVTMLSEEWMKSFEAGVKHAAKLGIDVTLGTGPGWTGSGGPWIKP